MKVFDWIFGEIKDNFNEDIEEGIEKIINEGLKSETVQLSFDKMMQAAYDWGRKDEKLNNDYRNFTCERHAKQRKRVN